MKAVETNRLKTALRRKQKLFVSAGNRRRTFRSSTHQAWKRPLEAARAQAARTRARAELHRDLAPHLAAVGVDRALWNARPSPPSRALPEPSGPPIR